MNNDSLDDHYMHGTQGCEYEVSAHYSLVPNYLYCHDVAGMMQVSYTNNDSLGDGCIGLRAN